MSFLSRIRGLFKRKSLKGQSNPSRRLVKTKRGYKLWIFSGVILLSTLFGYLEMQGVQTWNSGDVSCGGSVPCNGTFTIFVPPKLTNYLGNAVDVKELCFGKGVNVAIDPGNEVSDLKFWKADRRFGENNPLRWKPWNFNGSCIASNVNWTFKLNGTKSSHSLVKWGVSGTDIDPFWIPNESPGLIAVQSKSLAASLLQEDSNVRVVIDSFSANGTHWNLSLRTEPTNLTPTNFKGNTNTTLNKGKYVIASGLPGGKKNITTKDSINLNGKNSFFQNLSFVGEYNDPDDIDFELRVGSGTAIVVVQPTGFIAIKNDFANWTFNTNQAMMVKFGQPNGSISGEYGNGTNIYTQDGFAQMAPAIRRAGGSWCIGANAGSVQTTLNWTTNFMAEIGAVGTTCGSPTVSYTFFNFTGAFLLNFTDDALKSPVFAESWQGGVKPRVAPASINYKGNTSTDIDDEPTDATDVTTNWGIVARKPGDAASNWSCMGHEWNNSFNVARGPGQLAPSMGLSGGSRWNTADRPWKYGDLYFFTNATQTDCSAQLTAQYNESFTNTVTSTAYIGSILDEGDRHLSFTAKDNGSNWVQWPINNSAAGYGVFRAYVVKLLNSTSFTTLYLYHRAPGESTWIQDCYVSPTNATVQSDANMCAIGNTAHGYPAFLLYQQNGIQNMEYLITPQLQEAVVEGTPDITAKNTTNAPDFTSGTFIITGPNQTSPWKCGPQFDTRLFRPNNQTALVGVYNVSNNGTATGNFQAKLTTAANTNWSIYLSNDSQAFNKFILLTTSYQTFQYSATQYNWSYAWVYMNCSFVSNAPGTLIQFQAVAP